MTSIPLPAGLPPDSPFTAQMADDAGVARKHLEQLILDGRLRRPMRSVYVAAPVPDTLNLRVRSLSLVMPEDAFAADHTAAWLHAGDHALAPNSDLEPPAPTLLLPGGRGRLRNPVCRSGHRIVRDEDLMLVHGLRVTTPLRTAWDLGRVRSRDVAQWGLDLMMHVGGFDHEELAAGLPRFKGERGVVQLRSLVPWTDPGAESFGESALRLRWRDAGLPRPETQIRVLENGCEVARIDIGLRECLFGTEYDGAEWHGDEATSHDEARRSWLRDTRGYAIEVFRRDSVFGHHQDADQRLRRAHAAAVSALGSKRHFLLLDQRQVGTAA